MDFSDRDQVEKKLTKLIKEVQKAKCSDSKYKELGSILNEIGQNEELFEEYKDLYYEISDKLIMAGINLEKCGCDPIRGKIPEDKKPKT